MSRKQTVRVFTLTTAAIFGLALWQTIRHWAWLDANHVAGMVILPLLGLGMLILAVPLQLNALPDTMTPAEMAWDVARRSVLMLLAMTAISLIFVVIGFLLTIPARMERPFLLLPGFFILVPIVLAAIDFARGHIRRTPAKLFWSWMRHSFELYYLLLVQLGTIPIAFLIFPAGIILQLITLVEEGIRLFSTKPFDSMPLLCEWTNVSQAACGPTLITVHIGHLILLVVAAKYGSRLLDRAGDGFAAGMMWLEGKIID